MIKIIIYSVDSSDRAVSVVGKRIILDDNERDKLKKMLEINEKDRTRLRLILTCDKWYKYRLEYILSVDASVLV